MSINWPTAVTEKSFLKDFWQKKPLLIRNAFSEIPQIISPEELAGMALDSEVESRIIKCSDNFSDWQLFNGPFEEEEFLNLPESYWTLLVQDIDKHIPAARNLIDQFNFIPSWRIDDLMISYAADQGSVGPHTDSYDVFLIQLEGKRLWQINDEDYSDSDLLPDSDVRVLNDFTKQQVWLLGPGDMLYLPPNVAHWGIAQGSCLTASVGFLAPSASELFSAWADKVLDKLDDSERYSDPDLLPRKSPTELTISDIQKVDNIIMSLISNNHVSTHQLFGEIISQSKSHLEIFPHQENINIEQHPIKGLSYQHHPYLRIFYSKTQDNQVLLFANGETFELDSEEEFARYLCENNEIVAEQVSNWMKMPKNKQCFQELVKLGCIEILNNSDENN